MQLNSRLEVSLAAQDLLKVFEIIDRDRNGYLNLEEIREITKLGLSEEQLQTL